MISESTTPAFFEAKYRADEDPWRFATSSAELQRYAAILRALGDRRYGQGFEPACSIGVLTEQLAPRCDGLLAVDLSATAAQRAAVRCAHLAGVEVRCGAAEDVALAEPVDLLVLSEIGYYFTEEQWGSLVRKLLGRCTPDCTIVASHWLGSSADHLTTGDQVHASLRREPRLQLEHEERHETFRLDRFSLVRP